MVGKEKGFSLVELSIVLVILGLLTGGILTGQNLIRAAELRSVATEYKQFKTAIYTFRDKYFAMPGDMSNATDFWDYPASTPANCPATAGSGTETCNGDADGIIDKAGAASRYNEAFMVWQHLANAGLIEGSYTGIAGTTGNKDTLLGVNIPSSKLSNSGWFLDHRTDNSSTPDRFDINYGNVFSFGLEMGAVNNVTRGDALIPEEAWNIDTKIDDGKPGRGKVILYGLTTCTDAADKDDLDGSYLLTYTGKDCGLMIKLD